MVLQLMRIRPAGHVARERGLVTGDRIILNWFLNKYDMIC